MQFFEDIRDHSTIKIIDDSIKAYGFAPEHNYYELLSYDSKDVKTKFVSLSDHKGVLLIAHDNNTWQVLSEILAPKEERADIFIELSEHLFINRGAKKMMVEFPFDLRREIMRKVREKNKKMAGRPGEERQIVIGDVVEHYYTPLIDLGRWDPELKGSEMSKLRKAKHRFFRNYEVKVFKNHEISQIPKENINTMIRAWVKNRKAKDTAIYDSYFAFVENGFKGAALTVLITLNGEVKGLASASLIPNSSNSVYYGINLHDYSISELGDFLTVVFLDELKKEGFNALDFGASDRNLLKYKQKFGPVSQYDLAFFYVRYEPVKKQHIPQ